MPLPLVMGDLSTTASANSPLGTESPTQGDDFLRNIQAIVRSTNAKGADIASSAITDIGAATGEFVDVTGTATITSLGTVSAGIVRTVRFTGSATLTHSAALNLIGLTNIITANGDIAQFRSLGGGNWKCTNFIRQDGSTIIKLPAFYAVSTASQSITSGAFTKVTLGTEQYDTNNNYDATLSRFTPTVAGYYQITGIVRGQGTNITQVASAIYLNGVAHIQGGTTNIAAVSAPQTCVVSSLVLMNGTTDYVELFGNVLATTPTFDVTSASQKCFFNGVLMRTL